MNYSIKLLGKILLPALMLVTADLYAAPTPTTGFTDFPAESFAGEEFCFDAPLSNTDAAVGYGPYLQLQLPPEITFTSATFNGAPVSTTNLGVLPTPPAGITDPLSTALVTGTNGYSLINLQPPIGSIVQNGPSLVMNICGLIDAAAPIGVPLTVYTQPIFQFGDTATGDNGAILGAQGSATVSPSIVRFIKELVNSENERPPGPSWPATYQLRIDIANGNTIENLDFSDLLPADLQYVAGSLAVNVGTTGAVCNTNVAGQNINVTCDQALGSVVDNDLIVTYQAYVKDVLDEMVCDDKTLTNTATFNVDRNDGGNLVAVGPLTDSDVLSYEHVKVQKSVSPGVLQGQLVSPDDILTYTLNIQTTDYGVTDSLILTDILPDGLDPVSFNTVSVTLNGGNVVVVPSLNHNNVSGTTTVIYDIGAITGDIPAGSAVQVVYTADVEQAYENGVIVKANDYITNDAEITYGLTAGANACTDTSSATAKIKDLSIKKSIVNPQAEYNPGDTVKYLLSMDIPSGDTSSIIFKDFFPLPIFDVTTIDPTFGVDVVLAPSNTIAGIVPTGAMVFDSATNSLTINWPDITTTTPQTLAIEISIDIGNQPFADNLSLSNLFESSTSNSPDPTPISDLGLISINVRAPILEITKGIIATTHGNITPAVGNPPDSNLTSADGGDTVTYQITVENTGGAPAHDVVITDDLGGGIGSELQSCAITSVQDGGANALAYTGGVGAITLTNPLPASSVAPATAGFAIVTMTCDVKSSVQPGEVITNKSSVVWGSGGAGLFPAVEDTATVSIRYPSILKTKLTAGTTFTIGQILRYEIEITVPELTINNFIINDQLDPGLAFVSFTNTANYSLTSSAAVTTSPSVFNVTNSGTTLALNLGTVTNSNTTDGTIETITLAYDVVVVNDANANAGNLLNNQAAYGLNNTGGNYITGTVVNAPEITIVEPNIVVTKTDVTVGGGPYDAGDTITYDLFVRQTGVNLSDAFEVSLKDTFPANVTYVANSLIVASGSCSTGVAPVFDNPTANTLTTTWAQFTTADSCNIQYSVTLDQGVLSGTTLQNDVAIEWSNLSGTHDATKSIYNANACERTSVNNAGNCGTANDYDAASLANIQIGNVTINKTLVSTSEAITGDTQHDVGESDLAIGETATFRLVVTIPEGTSDFITITDNLPNAASGVMEYVSSTVTIGTNLRDNTGAAQLTDVGALVISGANTIAQWSFGQVVNIGDNVVDDQDRIIIEITGIIKDNALNVDASNLTNNSSVNFGAGLNGTSSVNLDIVEPKLQILKSSVTTTADAGDAVIYSITISHTGASTQEAFDVVMTDIVPTGMTYVANSILTAGTCNLTPTSPPSDADPSGSGLSVVLDNLPLAQSCSVTFVATLDNNVNPGQQITNTAGLVWDSLPADNDLNERSYSDSNGHLLTISSPGVSKVVTATSVGDTIINAPTTELTIGEQVTYQFTMTMPEGDTNNVVILDQLPTAGVALEYVSSQIVSIGSDIAISSVAAVVGAPGNDCGACNSNGDAYRDQAQWNLGTINNPPNGGGKTIVFEVVAVVVDDAVNTYADNDARNVASISFPDVVNGGTTTITGDVGVDLVEPILTIAKKATPAASPFFADAGDTVTFEITVDNNAANNSEANAYNLVITDTLANNGANALMEWNGDLNVGGTCVGTTVNSANASAAPFNVIFSVPTLALGSSCTITYQVKVATLVQPSQTLTNSAALAYDSTSTAESSGETRTGTASITSDVVINDASGLVKVVASTGHAGTNASQHNVAQEDLTIGETVTYSITMSIPQGTTNNVVLVDIMPTGAGGVIEVVGTPTISLGGANITTTNSTVTVNGALDGFKIDFGSVTNVPDADTTNDKITVTVTGIVTDVAVNADGLTPTNTANFTFTDGAGAGQVKSDTAIVDLVAPQMVITKSMTVLDGLVTVTVALENIGTATAYDINITDVLDSANWDTAAITLVTVPAGYTMTTVPGPLATETTVVMGSDAGSASPANSIEVGEAPITFVFTVPALPNVATINNVATNTSATTLPGAPAVERNVAPVVANASINIPLMTVVKTANPTAMTAAGTINYTIDINNPGVAPLTAINVADTLPNGNPGAVAGPTGDANNNSIIDAGETWQYTISYNVSQPEIDAGVARVNSVSVTTAEITTPVTDTATTTINSSSSMTVNKQVNLATISAPGTLSYTIDVDNTATTSLTNIVITDTLPDGTNGVLTGPTGDTDADSEIDVNETWQYTVTYSVDQAEMDAGTDRVNNVSVTTTEIPVAVTDSATTTITQTPSMTVVKQVDLATVSAPGTLSYTIDVANTGNVSLTNIAITDTLPDGTNGVLTGPTGDTDADSQIDVGETWQYTVTYAVDQVEMDAGVDRVNNVTVTTTEIPAGVTGSATTTITQNPLMTVVKQVDLATISAPGTLSYTIDVDNTGNVSLTNIAITDTLPDGANGVLTGPTGDTDADSEIDVNETWQYTVTYTVDQAEMDAGVDRVNNVTVTTAEIAAPGVSSSATTTITQNPSMTVEKQVDRSAISAVGVLNYTITVTNTGNISLTNVIASDTLPDASVVALAAPTGDTDADGELDIDETWVYTISYTPAQAEIIVGNDIVNSVSVDSDQTVALIATATTMVVSATVPTLSEWSRMLLILLLGLFSLYYQKKMVRKQYR